MILDGEHHKAAACVCHALRISALAECCNTVTLMQHGPHDPTHTFAAAIIPTQCFSSASAPWQRLSRFLQTHADAHSSHAGDQHPLAQAARPRHDRQLSAQDASRDSPGGGLAAVWRLRRDHRRCERGVL